MLFSRLGYNSFQNDMNEVNFHKLKAFVTQFHGDNGKAASLIVDLKEEIKRPVGKNIRLLQLVEEVIREVNGIRVTCCKSAKDRTGMSITLEEVRFALARFDSGSQEKQLFKTALDTLRRYDV